MTDDSNPYSMAARWELEAELQRRDRAEASPTFTTDQIADPTFWRDHKREIMKAASEGRIVEPEPVERPAPVYPPSVIPGWRPTGPDMFEAPAPAPKVKEQP